MCINVGVHTPLRILRSGKEGPGQPGRRIVEAGNTTHGDRY